MPLETSGKLIVAVAVLPAVSVMVTVAAWPLALAVVGVPLTAPVEASIARPGGRPLAL